MARRKSKKYYLEQIRTAKMTYHEVAEIFDTSAENVQKALIEYEESRNPFRKPEYKWVSIVEKIVSIISVLLVFFTLREMQIERDHSYLPDICFQKTSFALTWDKNGLISPESEEKWLLKGFEQLDILGILPNEIPRIELVNIGIGTAKSIHVEWKHKDNMKALSEYLYEFNQEADFSYHFDANCLNFYSDKSVFRVPAKPFLDVAYMKTEPQGDYLWFPEEYWTCIQQICRNYMPKQNGLVLPNLEVMISFKDIQGKEYQIKKKLKLEVEMLVLDPSGSGNVWLDIYEI